MTDPPAMPRAEAAAVLGTWRVDGTGASRTCSTSWPAVTRASAAIEEAAGRIDGLALGEWVHGGDIRQALDLPAA
jgi:hypothetical protein